MTVRTKRIFRVSATVVAVLAVGGAVALVGVLRSEWLRSKLRERIVAETEKATGGRVEIGRFDFDWRKLEAKVAPFVLHGKERPDEPVFFKAASIHVGLRIGSLLRKDIYLRSLIVDRPELRVFVYPDGTTNVPQPRVRRRGPPMIERFISLSIRHFELRDGLAEVSSHRVPLNLRGDDLQAALDYHASVPSYMGHVSSRKLHVDSKYMHDAAFDFDSDVTIQTAGLTFSKTVLDTGKSRVVANGSLHSWSAPSAEFDYDARLLLADVASVAPIPVEPVGDLWSKGKIALSFDGGFKLRLDGNAVARDLAYRDTRVRVSGVGVRTGYHVDRDGILMPNIVASVLGGRFEGRAAVKRGFRIVEVEGSVHNIGLDEITRVSSQPKLAWSGIASGPVRLEGAIEAGRARDFTLQANMDIQRAPGGIPIRGNLDLIYDQSAGSLRLGNSSLETDSTRITLSGTLGETLRAGIRTSDLNDMLPGLAMVSIDIPRELPLRLTNGSAAADFVVSGPLSRPAISGRVQLRRFESHGRAFDSLTADVAASFQEFEARNVVLIQGAARVTGVVRLGLESWKLTDSGELAANLKLRGMDMKQIAAEAGRKWPVSGEVAATAEVRGNYGAPIADVDVTVDRPVAYGENFDQLRAEVRTTNRSVEVKSAVLRLGRSRMALSGVYLRQGSDWATGAARFEVEVTALMLDQLKHVRDVEPGLSGAAVLKAKGTARITKSVFDLDTLDAELRVGGISVGSSPLGTLRATGRTRNDMLDLQIHGTIRGSELHGSGQWKLSGDYPGRGEIQFEPLTLAALHEIAVRGKVERELPFAGSVGGTVTITGALRKPETLQAGVILPKIEVKANPRQPLRAGLRGQDIVLRNTVPVELSATTKSVTIERASFAATDTSLEAAGRVTFNAQSPWDVVVKGRMNLAILQLFNSDLIAEGNALLNANLRGPLRDPQVGGRLELKDASLYLNDLPAGVDNVNGVVTFDRNRANIESLTAEVGGGRIGFGGFIGFANGVLLYRVQASADQMRVRQGGVSVTANALLNLTGTSENGLISGTVTVLRAGFAPRADLGGLLAQTTQPLPAPAAPNEYLRGLSFDVRIESGPSLTFQTSLTRDVQAEAELRLRGNAARPVLLGDISVSQGEVQFFGNKYTINRGDVRFLNPTKIDPVFDVDLATKARGITVNIAFTGTLNKLNLTYRSDPPLQTNDIIALLAVGRDPTTSAFANAQSRSNLLQSGANTLGAAVAAPVSSRLQRFFGVSRLKIDPQLTGVENIPQARLTLEQQVSRDITLTYITNLARTQEQLVRVQWDINREWSAIAVREENGVFGIDFQYKKRFK
jgi:translocation and assembly module TamB